jgi:hypothetical protein
MVRRLLSGERPGDRLESRSAVSEHPESESTAAEASNANNSDAHSLNRW